jgi:hypothetical protein
MKYTTFKLAALCMIGFALPHPMLAAFSRPAAYYLAADTYQTFSFTGSCEVQCSNGQCKQVCESGVVYGYNYSDAKRQAEAKVKLKGQTEGRVLNATIEVKLEARW